MQWRAGATAPPPQKLYSLRMTVSAKAPESHGENCDGCRSHKSSDGSIPLSVLDVCRPPYCAMEAAAVCISGALLMFTFNAIARQSNSAGVRTRNSELHSARKRPANGRNDTFFTPAPSANKGQIETRAASADKGQRTQFVRLRHQPTRDRWKRKRPQPTRVRGRYVNELIL